MDITWVEPTQLKMDPENINEHSAEQLKRLAKLIQYQGWRLPIVVSKQDDLIKAGHGRVQAAIDYNLGKVPVSYQDFVSDEQAAAFRVSDNAIASWANLNLAKLNSQLPDMDPTFDVELYGLKDFEIEPADKDVLADAPVEPETEEQDDRDKIPEHIEPVTQVGDQFKIGSHKVLNGDCLEVLKTLADNSIDALVTDPPYGWSFMGKGWDHFEIQKIENDKRRTSKTEWIGSDGISRSVNNNYKSFASGEYDRTLTGNNAFEEWTRKWATEVFRVLKPGAHAIVHCGPRTYHRMACGVEDAGFEVRDQLQWLFGSGFPKSHDISKAIDKAAGAEREVIGFNPNHRGESQRRNPYTKSLGQDGSVTTPSTPEAKQWQGWGTALKPSNEPILLARKPCSEDTVAANVVKWGTGGINIDASRVATTETGKRDHKGKVYDDVAEGYQRPGASMYQHKTNWEMPAQGRFPANLLLSHNPDCVEVGTKKVKASGGEGLAPTNYKLSQNKTGQKYFHYASEDGTETVSAWECTDGCAVAALDEQSGVLHPGGQSKKSRSKDSTTSLLGIGIGEFGEHKQYKDIGGASRFFYCAKISTSERNAGQEQKNNHPTCKPIRLMQYLITMVTPNGGTILDPFAGSGSTLVAAHLKGFNTVNIEQAPEYTDIIIARAEHATQQKAEVIHAPKAA